MSLAFVTFLMAATVSVASAQQAGQPPRPSTDFELEQNYPNPFNPETRVPFVLGEGLFQSGQPVRVTIRIYNILSQLVASPTALGHVEGEGVAVDNLEYGSPGRYEAYWDGHDRSGAQVASGVYFVQITVNGRSQIKRMLVAK
ncbi:MAG: hypothetical protein R3E10_02165 [Gemmatimonadota bacterium]